MRLTIDQALARYGAQVGLASRNRRLSIIRRYLEQGGGADDVTFGRWVRELEIQGYKPASIAQRMSTIQTFFRTLGMRPPRAPFAFDPQQDSARPALAPETVAQLIHAARRGALSPWHTGLLALSSVYGLRAAELAAVQDRDMDRGAERVYVRTMKHGVPRWVWCPPALWTYLPDRWPMATVAAVERAFGVVWAAAFDREKPARVAWHSVRRSLVAGLDQAGVPAEAIDRFLRWRTPATGARVRRLYAQPTALVTEAGAAAVAVPEGTAETDAEIWAAHPHLGFWGV